MSISNDETNLLAEVAVLNAYEAELFNGPDDALRILVSPSDPIRMRAWLSILFRAGRASEACDLVKHREPDEKWLDIGALVLSSTNKLDDAIRLIEAAERTRDDLLIRRTRASFGEGAVFYLRSTITGGRSIFSVHSWSEEQIELARETTEVLDIFRSRIVARKAIDGEIERVAAESLVVCAHVTSSIGLLKKISDLLVRYSPLPLIVAELCLTHIIEIVDGLTVRLRSEHGDDFRPHFLAAVVELDLLNRPKEAFLAFKKLSQSVVNDQDKESLSLAIFESGCELESALFEESVSLIATLRPGDTRLLSLAKAARHLRFNEVQEARNLLDQNRNVQDGVWWQCYADLLDKEGKSDEAADAWIKASELFPHPAVIRRSIVELCVRRRFERALASLQMLVDQDPGNESDRLNLVKVCFQLGDFVKAASHLEHLVESATDKIDFQMMLGNCYWRLSSLTKAAEVLRKVCSADNPPLESLLMLSDVLIADGRASEAFEALESVAADFWDEPEFLIRYMNCGYAANRDRDADKVFIRLAELNRSGGVPRELMQEVSLDDFLEYGKEFDRKREDLQQGVVIGKYPWLVAEHVLGNPATWAWRLHTQKLRWLSEEPLSRAAYSIYATNGFTVVTSDGESRIERLSCPSRQSSVMIDLSALLTLSRLDRLSLIVDFFDGVVLPSRYQELRITEAGRFGLNQPSREAELGRIRDARDQARIAIYDDFEAGAKILDEYCDSNEREVYRVIDLLKALHLAQKLTPEMEEELNRLSRTHSSEGIGDCQKAPQLDLGADLAVDLHTLRVIAGSLCFDIVLEAFRVSISESDWSALTSELTRYSSARSAKLENEQMWDSIMELSERGLLTFSNVPDEDNTEWQLEAEENGPSPVHLDPIQIAWKMKWPLIADDRFFQVAMLSRYNESEDWSCGSDRVLEEMIGHNGYTKSQYASDLLKLMQWRYRFVVPSADVLFQFAIQGLPDPPGSALIEAASYLHECLRDPGLLCGLENTKPPLPMAYSFTKAWIDSISTFIAMIWADNTFEVEKAAKLTEWVTAELFPSCPKGLLLSQMGYMLTHEMSSLALGMASTQFAVVQDIERARMGLREFAKGLGVSAGSEFLGEIADIIENI